jgi:cytochrome c-type biogenesis protein CcmH/NrfG
VTEPSVSTLEERRDRIVADLRDLDAQDAIGEIDAETAAELRRRYEVELAEVLSEIDEPRPEPRPGRSPRRIAIGLAVFAMGATAAVVGLTNAVDSDPSGTTAAFDLSSVTNQELEGVVAANPDVVPMRLALARRYVEAGEFSSALPHYMYILERGPNAEALMYVGWMTYLSDDAATGALLLERSLELDPGDVLAKWFLANIRYYGLADATAAIPLLEAVIASGQAPPDIVAEAERMITEADI